MKFTKILCVVMTFLMLVSMLQLSAFASVVDVTTTEYAVNVTSYEQLKSLLYNSPNGELFVLANDIIVEDYLELLSIFYVAVTRAKKQIYFSASKKRYGYKGETNSNISCLLSLPGIMLS